MMPCFQRLGTLFALWATVEALDWELPGPYTIFKTEPTFVPSQINVTYCTKDRDLLAPGYHFVAPHIANRGYGPQILDNDGNLIWYGNPTVAHFAGKVAYGLDFYVCDFMGGKMNHICYSEGRPRGGKVAGIKHGGANKIFNNAYEPVVDEFVEMGNLSVPNPHEFNVLPGGRSFIQAVYWKTAMDLRDYKGPKHGTVANGCFQDIDIKSRSVLFQWCYLDHHEIWETYLYLNVPENKENISSSTSGAGIYSNPWDFMHLNAIDKNSEGDYLVSSRHLSQILKIAGPNSTSGLPAGSTIWRLNGKHSDFEIEEDAKFARQHHCRFVSTSKTETVISLFNNVFNNTYTKSDRSNGMVLRLNNETMKATLDHIYENPFKKISIAQGSMSVLPGDRKNAYVGWGSSPQWSEFTQNGTLLYNAMAYANKLDANKIKADKPKPLTNYRAFKFPWIGKPKYPPKLLAYSPTCQGSLTAYASWNGATEVGSWRFYVHNKLKGKKILVGTFDKDGFETKVRLSSKRQYRRFKRWVTVEALDKTDHTVIGETTAKIFVPRPRIKKHCNRDGCFESKRYSYPQKDARPCKQVKNQQVYAFSIPTAAILFLIVLAIECWEFIIFKSLQGIVDNHAVYLPVEGQPVPLIEKPTDDHMNEEQPIIT